MKHITRTFMSAFVLVASFVCVASATTVEIVLQHPPPHPFSVEKIWNNVFSINPTGTGIVTS